VALSLRCALLLSMLRLLRSPVATSVCGLTLLVYEALSYYLLVYEAVNYYLLVYAALSY
jgi:hypothetical protein